MTAEQTYPITDPAARTDKGVTVRSLIFGLVLVIAINALATVARYIMHSSFMAYSHMPMGNLMLTLLCLIVCSVLARYFGKRFAFSPGEWLAIFSMGFICSLGPTYGVSGYLVGVIVTPYYFSTPENRWAEFLHPYLPEWIIPSNRDGAISWFYDGLPAGAPAPFQRQHTPCSIPHLLPSTTSADLPFPWAHTSIACPISSPATNAPSSAASAWLLWSASSHPPSLQSGWAIALAGTISRQTGSSFAQAWADIKIPSTRSYRRNRWKRSTTGSFSSGHSPCTPCYSCDTNSPGGPCTPLDSPYRAPGSPASPASPSLSPG